MITALDAITFFINLFFPDSLIIKAIWGFLIVFQTGMKELNEKYLNALDFFKYYSPFLLYFLSFILAFKILKFLVSLFSFVQNDCHFIYLCISILFEYLIWILKLILITLKTMTFVSVRLYSQMMCLIQIIKEADQERKWYNY